MAARPRPPEPSHSSIRASAITCSRPLPSELACLVSAFWSLCLLHLDPNHLEKSQPTSTAMEYPISRLCPPITEAVLTPLRFSSATETALSGPDQQFNLPTPGVTHS